MKRTHLRKTIGSLRGEGLALKIERVLRLEWIERVCVEQCVIISRILFVQLLGFDEKVEKLYKSGHMNTVKYLAGRIPGHNTQS